MPTDEEKETFSFRKPGSTAWLQLNLTPEGPDDKSRAANDELRQMLLTALQMQHMIVLAGSGCSIVAGGPTMTALWDAAVGDPPKPASAAIAKKVGHAADTKDIEALLSRMEAYLQVQEDALIREALNGSKKVILDRCSAFLDTAKLETHRTFLHRLSRRRVRDERLKVFTTNYDLCFEAATADIGGVFLDGFSFAAPRRYDPRFFGYDIVRRDRAGADPAHYLEGVFLLHKLHGSVNWARQSDGSIVETSNPTPENACLIYPARGKFQQAFVQPHLESLAQYLSAVREPNTCVLVIGFGFNDDHLSEPLLSAIRSNPHLRVVIVNRGAEERVRDKKSSQYWHRFSELAKEGEDVWFVSVPFETFARLIPDLKSLTPADSLVKALKAVTREP